MKKKGKGWFGNPEAHARAGRLGGLSKGGRLEEENELLKKENKALRKAIKVFCKDCCLQKKGYCFDTDCALYETSPYR